MFLIILRIFMADCLADMPTPGIINSKPQMIPFKAKIVISELKIS